MKILAFTDVHRADPKIIKKALLGIVKKAQQADIMICCGDISLFGKGFKPALNILMKADKPLLIIHGNHEEEREVSHLQLKNVIPFHRKPHRIGNYLFLGHGGGGFSIVDRKLEQRIAQFKEKIQPGDKVILVTHGPPHNTELDYLPLYGSVGCRSITKAIKELKPQLYLCGHIHENFTVHQKLGQTLMLNPGPLGTLIEI
ncbi:MAG: metallophosphoesterase family protein [Candidatus Woesearchaeota archaeon]|nr:metallophosphoesterase family protein [Candidatus Woesearchaeota archaeon]